MPVPLNIGQAFGGCANAQAAILTPTQLARLPAPGGLRAGLMMQLPVDNFRACSIGEVDLAGTWLGKLQGVIGRRFFAFLYARVWERTAAFAQVRELDKYLLEHPFSWLARVRADLAALPAPQVSFSEVPSVIWHSLKDEPNWVKALVVYTDDRIRQMSKLEAMSLYYSLLYERDDRGDFHLNWSHPISRAFGKDVAGEGYGFHRYLYGLDVQDRIYALRPDLRDITLSDGSKGQGLIDPNLIDRALGGYGDSPRKDWTDTAYLVVNSLFAMISPWISLAQFGMALQKTIADMGRARGQAEFAREFLGNVARVERTIASGALSAPVVSDNTPTPQLIVAAKNKIETAGQPVAGEPLYARQSLPGVKSEYLWLLALVGVWVLWKE